ncbi:helix-turn-helix domain-containing protein [Pseudomonas putida]|uniref:helix-turn-helix domain-containing protein n=1 Tax=Pseudomonas putida TaxID=303 RepID=UPI0018A94D68|nr:LysR family transcriptional regulator [Pseudomonas putida]
MSGRNNGLSRLPSQKPCGMFPCMAAFAVVVETGSFAHASTRLGLTASAVSKQVSKLENSLSIRLLERWARRLKVNAEGAQILTL